MADDTGKADVLDAFSPLFVGRLNVIKCLTWSELTREQE